MPQRANFRYFKARTKAPDAQGSLQWTDVGYNDQAGWGGNAQPFGFGYKIYGGYTEFAAPLDFIAVYLRSTFQVSNPASYSHLTFVVDYDDGFVAYLNGTEIARRNLPSGEIAYNTLATTNHGASHASASRGSNEEEYIPVDPSLLVAGNNVLAVQVHNVSSTSGGLFMSARLNEGLNLTRGPFIQLPETTGVAVAWSTDRAVTAEVDWGTDLSYSGGTVSLTQANLRQVAQLPIPRDGGNYFYRIRSEGKILADGIPLRAPRTASQRWRAVVYGDWGSPSSLNRELGLAVHNLNPDLQLTVGDNSQMDGAPGDYNSFWFTPFSEVMRYAPLMPTIGGHDTNTRDGYWFQKYLSLPKNGPSSPEGMKEKTYSFDYGSAHIITLDTEVFEQNKTEEMTAIQNWLQADLAATAQPWKIVLLHRPPYTSLGNHGAQTQVRDMLTPIMQAGGVQFVFQGHNHHYERTQPIYGVRYLTVGGTAFSTHTIRERKIYSAFLKNDSSFLAHFEIEGPAFHFEMQNWEGGTIDKLYLNLSDPFKMDGVLDAGMLPLAQNGLHIYAAIKGHHLYVATQDAAGSTDHFVYLSRSPGALKPAGWGKAGYIAAWDAFLADESINGFAGWFDAAGSPLQDVVSFQSATPGFGNNAPHNNGALEGIVDVRQLWGEFPTKIYLAAAAYATDDGGALAAQVPAGSGDGNISASQFLEVDARSIALDLPVAAISTAPNSHVVSGQFLTLNGSTSQNPSSLPLSFSWRQLSGPPCIIENPTSSSPRIRSTVSVTSPQAASFELLVNDTRFDSDPASITITIDPLPAGSPLDSDGDGQTDAQEAIAGTDAFDPSSVLRIHSTTFSQNSSGNVSSFTIHWPSVIGTYYSILYSDDLLSQHWQPLTPPIQATSTSSTHTDTLPQNHSQRFYRISTSE